MDDDALKNGDDFRHNVIASMSRHSCGSSGSPSVPELALIERLSSGRTITKDVNQSFDAKLSVGQRLADKVAQFGGSWTFIIFFAFILAMWVGINMIWVARAFDPYPFIFLNLVLSMLAAVQAPIIMMSQNRQAARDRLDAEHDYEVNLKAEIEIMALHEKLDQMRSNELKALIDKQQAQIELLSSLLSSYQRIGK